MRAARGGAHRPASRDPRLTTRPGAEPPPGHGGDAGLPDDELVRRVRASVAIPRGVEVAVAEGALVLFGRIARHALEPLLQQVARVDGVSVIEDRLTPVDEPFHERPA